MDKMRIKDIDLTQAIVVEIGKFAVLWNVFENDKCSNNCTVDKLLLLADSFSNIDSGILACFATALRGRVDMLANGVEEYVEYILTPERARQMNEKCREQVALFIDSNGRESLVGGLLAIYRIRNNLFHGLKELSSLNEQIELFRTMNRVLEDLIKR